MQYETVTSFLTIRTVSIFSMILASSSGGSWEDRRWELFQCVLLRPSRSRAGLWCGITADVTTVTSACQARVEEDMAAIRPEPNTAMVSPSSSTTLKSRSSLYFRRFTWRPDRLFCREKERAKERKSERNVITHYSKIIKQKNDQSFLN